MANSRLIKRRIKSAQNIAKITKAMEMVSASKMRRAQEQAQASQPYANKLHSVLHTIATFTDPSLHPLLQDHPSGRPVLVVVSTDRGLLGPLNANLFRAVSEFVEDRPDFTTIVIGRKAQEFVSRMGWHITASFENLPEKISFGDTLPVAQMIRDGFLGDDFSSVHVLHMEFVNTLTQRPQVTELLPLRQEELVENEKELPASDKTTHVGQIQQDYQFEPSAKEILDWLLPYYVEVEIYQILLDARASEHSARMIAMQNASNNANEVVGSLQLEYNKTRQAAITQELIEITTTKEYS